MDPPKRLSIAHWKALGESYLLSHKSSSGGGGGGGGSMKELCPLEESKYIFLLNGNTFISLDHLNGSTSVTAKPLDDIIKKSQASC